MKKTIIHYSILLFFLLFSFSCEKDDEFLTSGEIVAKELSTIIKNNQIELASIYIIEYYDGVPYLTQKVEKEKFQIENVFFIVNQQYYNLDQLDRFEIILKESTNFVKLYF